MKSKKQIIIDTDPGIDDALAILMLLNSKEIEVKAITTVAGNQNIQTVTNNAATIIKQSGKNIPLFSGSAKPLVKKLQVGKVMGKTGLGKVQRIAEKKLNQKAVSKILELVSKKPGQISILAIGPLTNIAIAIKSDPSFCKNVKKIVIMGGAIEIYGNMSRVAEFNFFVDPEAADIVFSSSCKKILIPLDRCYEVPLFKQDFYFLKDSKLYGFIKAMIDPYIENLSLFEGRSGAIVYDALAAYYFINSSAFETSFIDIKIETKGKLTRGMCVVEKRLNVVKKLNVEVVNKLNISTFKKAFLKRLNCF